MLHIFLSSLPSEPWNQVSAKDLYKITELENEMVTEPSITSVKMSVPRLIYKLESEWVLSITA